MNINNDNIKNEFTAELTYMRLHEHLSDLFFSHWQTFSLYVIGSFGLLYGLIEAQDYFLKTISFDNYATLALAISISFSISLYRCISEYLKTIPLGLENEEIEAQKTAHLKKPFWEFKLAYILMKSRIKTIDQNIDDLINNRIHIQIIHTPNLLEYSQWLSMRPENLLRMVSSAKQLLIYDLARAIQTKKNGIMDISELIRTIDLIKNLYYAAYEFELEGKKIQVPNDLELLHEIQSKWVSVVQEGFRQMIGVLEKIGDRNKNDMSTVVDEIVFEEPPRMEEFLKEITRLEKLLLDNQ